MLAFISNTDHYANVLSRVSSVKHTLWIGTADIKDLYVDIGKEKKPFLALIAQLIKRDVDVRLIHAKEPGQNFRDDFDRYPVLFDTSSSGKNFFRPIESFFRNSDEK